MSRPGNPEIKKAGHTDSEAKTPLHGTGALPHVPEYKLPEDCEKKSSLFISRESLPSLKRHDFLPPCPRSATGPIIIIALFLRAKSHFSLQPPSFFLSFRPSVRPSAPSLFPPEGRLPALLSRHKSQVD